MTLIEKIEKGMAIVGLVGALTGLGGVYYNYDENKATVESSDPRRAYDFNAEQTPYLILTLASGFPLGLGVAGVSYRRRKRKEMEVVVNRF